VHRLRADFKLVIKANLYYDARSEKHRKNMNDCWWLKVTVESNEITLVFLLSNS
jgi:hypothetical protein